MPTSNSRYQIAILGAGLAGLAAAHRLIEGGYKNVLVIEAKDVPGGRIKSVKHRDGTRLDLGAQWLHGEKENPVYQWLKSMDLLEGVEEDEVEMEGLFSTQFGLEPDPNIVSKALEILLDTKQFLYKMSKTLDSNSRPVDIFRSQFYLAISSSSILKLVDRNLLDSILKWFELYETIDNSCEDISLLSMEAYSEWSDFDNGKMLRLRGGWQSLIDKLANEIGANRIIVNCMVKRVIRNESGFIIEHSKGSLQCDHVILTFSVGVLKHLVSESSFFKPPLNKERIDSIERVGFGSVNKIFLQFEQPYLQLEKGLKLLWFKDSTSEQQQFPEWARFITGFDSISSCPNTLLAWVGGKGASLMERYTDNEIEDTCLKLIETFQPDKQAPKLISMTRSKWSTDPHILGAYSYRSLAGLQVEDINWEPICSLDGNPLLQFAGEATSKSSFSTAHGAIESGWREADRIIKYLKSFSAKRQ